MQIFWLKEKIALTLKCKVLFKNIVSHHKSSDNATNHSNTR